jgi:outer membrane protein insertion porin family
MPVSGSQDFDAASGEGYFDSAVAPAQYGGPYDNSYNGAPNYSQGYDDAYSGRDDYVGRPGGRPTGPPTIRPGDVGFGEGPSGTNYSQPFAGRYADLEVNVQEQQTGRFMFGVGVNSDAGLTAQVVIDEYNFDWRRFPRAPGDFMNGTAFRGGGQRLRIEAVPGSQLQRYMVNFTEPYLILGGQQFTLNLSGYLFDRRYFDWDEQRLGGRVGLGYRVTPDLSLNTSLRMENVNINSPRIRGVTELEEVLGDNSLFSGTVSLRHDTRDSPFAPTEGHLFDISFEQAFGTFSYPRGVAEYRRFFLLNERVDGSGRHVLGTSLQTGFSGSDTPLFEHFFAGGYSTIRGFRFRGASPKNGDITVGGEFSLLGSVEYLFPVTADDMLKGVVFCDYGTIEEEISIDRDDFRVAVGAGLRVTVPAMGPAPIALDFAVPLTREDTDRIQNFSFFVGFGR